MSKRTRSTCRLAGLTTTPQPDIAVLRHLTPRVINGRLRKPLERFLPAFREYEDAVFNFRDSSDDVMRMDRDSDAQTQARAEQEKQDALEKMLALAADIRTLHEEILDVLNDLEKKHG